MYQCKKKTKKKNTQKHNKSNVFHKHLSIITGISRIIIDIKNKFF